MTEETNAASGAPSGVSDSTQLLAAKIARSIFEAGDEPVAFGGKTQRIQFMGGRWPEAEKPMGGLNEYALALCIESVLVANK